LEIVEQILYSIIGGMIVAITVEGVHVLIRWARRRREITGIRKHLMDAETSVKNIRGNEDGRLSEGLARLTYFKAHLQIAKQMAMNSDNLRGSERVELLVLLDGGLNLIGILPDGSSPELKYYEQFFGGLKKLKWLKL